MPVSTQSTTRSPSERPVRSDSLHPSLRNLKVEAPDFRSSAWCASVPTAAEELDPIHPTLLHAMAMAARHCAGAGITLLPEDPKGKEEQRSYARIHQESKVIAASLVEHGVK